MATQKKFTFLALLILLFLISCSGLALALSLNSFGVISASVKLFFAFLSTLGVLRSSRKPRRLRSNKSRS